MLTPEQNVWVEKNAHLASAVAASIWRKAPQVMELPELVSIAYLALVESAARFEDYQQRNGYDFNEDYFTPFAMRRMRGAVLDALRSGDWANRSLRGRVKQIQQAGHGTGVSDSEMAAKTGLSLEEVRSTVSDIAKRPVSLDAGPIEQGSPTSASVEQTAFEQHLCAVMERTIDSLEPAKQAVLALHYYMGYELRDIADMLNITESRASHLHTDAVLAVHEALRDAVQEVA